MRILILGATGFIGNAIFHSLIKEYDIIIGGSTKIDGFEDWRKVDFLKENDFDPILEGVDLVINAVGIINGDFKKVQTESPLELFKVCQRKRIKIINISAIGAEKDKPKTEFLRSKKVVDDFILSNTDGKVIYPGIVLGKNAQSTQFFKELSTLPVIPILGNKNLPLVHISQLTDTIKTIVKDYYHSPKQVFALSEPETQKDIFNAMRKTKGNYVNIPISLVSFLFSIFPKLSIGIFNKNMFTMLLTTSPDDYEIKFEKATTLLDRNHLVGSHSLLKMLGIFALSFIWLWSGIISLISWQQSLHLMATIHVTNQFAGWFICAGSFVDILLGISILFKRVRQNALLLQLIFIIIYTLILCVLAPQFWTHPFGPLSKNIPLMAFIFIMYKWEKNYCL